MLEKTKLIVDACDTVECEHSYRLKAAALEEIAALAAAREENEAERANRLRVVAAMERHSDGAWRWIGDGSDDLASMGDDMAVLIRAADLRVFAAAREENEHWIEVGREIEKCDPMYNDGRIVLWSSSMAGLRGILEANRTMRSELASIRDRDEGQVERGKSDRMREIGHEIRTQDNAITACPVFMVQRRRRIYWMDPAHAEAGDFVWVTEDEHIEADATEATTLDAKHAESADNRIDGFVRVAFIDLWENVQPFFTRKGAKEYLRINGHNLKPETRIYVESGWRNKEWEDIRAVLAAADGREP